MLGFARLQSLIGMGSCSAGITRCHAVWCRFCTAADPVCSRGKIIARPLPPPRCAQGPRLPRRRVLSLHLQPPPRVRAQLSEEVRGSALDQLAKYQSPAGSGRRQCVGPQRCLQRRPAEGHLDGPPQAGHATCQHERRRHARLIFRQSATSETAPSNDPARRAALPLPSRLPTQPRRYLVGDPLRAKCGASIRVELVDMAGSPVTQDYPDLTFEVRPAGVGGWGWISGHMC
jgi:hypothetical protein